MTEKMELDAGRTEGAGETGEPEREDLRRLDGVTLEPEAAVERGGDFREAEAIRGALASVIESGGELPGAAPHPGPHSEGAAEKQPGGKTAARSPAPAGEGGSSARERGADDDDPIHQFWIQNSLNPREQSQHSASDVKKKGDSQKDQLIQKIA